MAEELGADDVIRVPEQNVGAEAQKATGGLGVDAVVETTASAEGFSDAMSAVRKDGSVVLVGGYHKPLELRGYILPQLPQGGASIIDRPLSDV